MKETNNDKNLILELDADTDLMEKSEEGSLYPYDPSEADLDIKEDPQSVFQLMRKYDQGKLEIDPDFQRNLVWTTEQKSRFIESIILNFPLPPIYVNQKKNGGYIVIDGLQRTTTMHEFINNKFKLSGLEALPRLNNKYFKELDDLKAKIEDKKLLLFILKPSVPIKVIYDLFNRINTGGTPLNRQEVRNCIFIGKSTELLRELSEQKYFREAISEGISAKRMKDREAILRYISFRIKDYRSDYFGDMSSFLEKTMMIINQLDDGKISALINDFERVMKLTYDFFGENNFRLPTASSRGLVNIAILESVGYFFSITKDDYLHENKNTVKKNYKKLLNDPTFLNAVKYSTNSKNRVLDRFNRAQEILGKIT